VSKKNLKSIIESLLFSKGSSMSISQLAKVTEAGKKEVKEAVEGMKAQYEEEDRGIFIIENAGSVQLTTKPKNTSYIDQVIKRDLEDSLSRAALEVVSIVAYKGPVSRFDIEAIRGVNSSFTLRNLLMRGMIIKETDNNDQRGYLYKISFEFIKKLGLNSIKDLPNYEKLSHDERLESIVNIRSEKQ
jgi:segregation and condensation protein B